jgi:hypothetical protein
MGKAAAGCRSAMPTAMSASRSGAGSSIVARGAAAGACARRRKLYAQAQCTAQRNAAEHQSRHRAVETPQAWKRCAATVL